MSWRYIYKFHWTRRLGLDLSTKQKQNDKNFYIDQNIYTLKGMEVLIKLNKILGNINILNWQLRGPKAWVWFLQIFIQYM